MNTKAAAQVLRVDHETLLELARLGLVGEQAYAGELWVFTANEVADLLRIKSGFKTSLKEAAQWRRLTLTVSRLQGAQLDLEADLEFEPLQREAQELAKRLRRSKNRAIHDAVKNLVRYASGGAVKILQLD